MSRRIDRRKPGGAVGGMIKETALPKDFHRLNLTDRATSGGARFAEAAVARRAN